MIDVDNLFSLYDDVAVEVVEDFAAEAEAVCVLMGWEDFDIFEAYDFDGAMASMDPDRLMSLGYIALLRWKTFERAEEKGVGVSTFNVTAASRYRKVSEALLGKRTRLLARKQM